MRRLSLVCMAGLVAVLVFAAVAQAEAPSNAGKEFWLGFPSNIGGQEAAVQTLYITGGTATTGTVAIPGLSFSEAFSVTPGKVTAVKLPAETEMSGSLEATEEKAIHVTAGAPVVVYGLNDASFTTDAYTGLPTTVIGTSYTVLAFGAGLGGNSVFSVVPTQDNTSVTITPSVAAGESGAHPAGVPYTIKLNIGQEYQLVASNNPEDLTGTKITSSAPVSVFGGQECANIPSNEYFACDYVVEQNQPESTWGTSFLTEPLKTRSGGDDFEVVADQNETHVKLNGTEVATLNAGQHYSQEIEEASEITSDKPIQLAQYSNSSSFDNTTGDPFMITIPPFQQFETGYTITTPVESETVFANYVNLVVPSSAVGAIKIDGTVVPASEFHPIGSTGFDGAQVSIEPGSHVLSGNGQPFGAFSYGFSQFNGYGYPGGFSLAPVATVSHVVLAPATETATVNTEHCVTATVTDQSNNRVPDVRVDFTVTGVNSASGSVFANSEGEAQFCYTGTHTGKDTITGSVGLISGSAEKTWVSTSATPTKLTVHSAAGDFADPTAVSAVLVNSETSAPLSGKSVKFTLNASETCTGTTNASGEASCQITPAEAPGPYTLEGEFAGESGFGASTGSASFVVSREQTSLAYTGASSAVNGQPITLSGTLTTDDPAPGTGLAGKTVVFTLGAGASAQTCSGVTNASGSASCVVASVKQPVGVDSVTASFAGDTYYVPASVSSSVSVLEARATGAFVVGDLSAGAGKTVNFWGSQWAKNNLFSGGGAPASMKGFADSPTALTCGATWTTRTGNSSSPPATLPSQINVIVSSKVTQTGSTISGKVLHIVVVQVNGGYGPDPGHAGYGKVVGSVC
jgi:IgGFc binding protein/Bacterial Ig-like domain (group 1)